MPMVPGPLAALTYGAIKVAGYALFAKGLNRASARSVPALKFGLAKTAIGLVGGLAYVFAVVLALLPDAAEWRVYLGALPVRVVAWVIALSLFYRWRERRTLLLGAVLIGVAWSYAIDGVMAMLYKILPGMQMPFC